MLLITTYMDFLKAKEMERSVNPAERDEAHNALDILEQVNEEKYSIFYEAYSRNDSPQQATQTYRESVRLSALAVKKELSKKQKTPLSEYDARIAAMERLEKGRYKIGLLVDLPLGFSKENVLNALTHLSFEEIVTKNGQLVSYPTLRKRSLQKAAEAGWIEEDVFRLETGKAIWSFLKRIFRNEILPYPRQIIVELAEKEATMDELLKLYPNSGFIDSDRVCTLVDKKIDLSKKEVLKKIEQINLRQQQEEQERKKRKAERNRRKREEKMRLKMEQAAAK